MTTKKILKGLHKRLTDLETAYECLNKEKGLENVCEEYEIRIDEVESLIWWIEGKSGN